MILSKSHNRIYTLLLFTSLASCMAMEEPSTQKIPHHELRLILSGAIRKRNYYDENEKLKLERDIQYAKAEQLKQMTAQEEVRGRWGLASELAKAEKEDELARKRLQEKSKYARNFLKEQHNLAEKRNKKKIKMRAGLETKLNIPDTAFDAFLIKQHELQQELAGVKFKQKMQLLREKEAMRARTEIEKARIQAKEDRKTLPDRLEHDLKKTRLLHKQALEKLHLLGHGFSEFIKDPEKVTYTTLGVTGCILGYFASRKGVHVVGDHCAMLLRKPNLVTETSRLTLQQKCLLPFKTAQKYLLPQQQTTASLTDLILPKTTRATIENIAQGLKHVQSNGGYHRHLLLYGPPGTGKTLAARELSRSSGLDYAIMSGANFSQFNPEQQIEELNNLFKWARNSKKGLVLFIDEADAFLEKRDAISEQSRKLLTALLAQTGTETNKYMLIFATNRPEVLDPAVLNRIDEKIRIGLPDLPCRELLLRLYLQKWFFDKGCSIAAEDFAHIVSKPFIQNFDELPHSTTAVFSKAMEGFSGREISKFAIKLAHAAYAHENKMITFRAMHDMLDNLVEQHKTAKNYTSHI